MPEPPQRVELKAASILLGVDGGRLLQLIRRLGCVLLCLRACLIWFALLRLACLSMCLP
jgi:hypothetical protein